MSFISMSLSPYTRLASCSQSLTNSTGVLIQSGVENNMPYKEMYTSRCQKCLVCIHEYIYIYKALNHRTWKMFERSLRLKM